MEDRSRSRNRGVTRKEKMKIVQITQGHRICITSALV
jgi:hypothetical protein